MSGNFSFSGASLTNGTGNGNAIAGTINFTKSGTQTFAATAVGPTAITRVNYVVKSGSTLQLLSDLSLYDLNSQPNWNGHFTINNGGTLDAGTFKIFSSNNPTVGPQTGFTLSVGRKYKNCKYQRPHRISYFYCFQFNRKYKHR